MKSSKTIIQLDRPLSRKLSRVGLTVSTMSSVWALAFNRSIFYEDSHKSSCLKVIWLEVCDSELWVAFLEVTMESKLFERNKNVNCSSIHLSPSVNTFMGSEPPKIRELRKSFFHEMLFILFFCLIKNRANCSKQSTAPSRTCLKMCFTESLKKNQNKILWKRNFCKLWIFGGSDPMNVLHN